MSLPLHPAIIPRLYIDSVIECCIRIPTTTAALGVPRIRPIDDLACRVRCGAPRQSEKHLNFESPVQGNCRCCSVPAGRQATCDCRPRIERETEENTCCRRQRAKCALSRVIRRKARKGADALEGNLTNVAPYRNCKWSVKKSIGRNIRHGREFAGSSEREFTPAKIRPPPKITERLRRFYPFALARIFSFSLVS